MKRHSWKSTESLRGFSVIQRCVHCNTERVRDDSAKTLYAYRGGMAQHPGTLGQLPQDGTWAAFVAGVVPACVERKP